jgi:hypothetical protein
MPASPWRKFGSPDPNGDFVALLSYLPLKSYWRVPSFLFYTVQVAKQLASAPGLVGYSVLARPLSKRFWTLSAWKDEAALHAFVQHRRPRGHICERPAATDAIVDISFLQLRLPSFVSKPPQCSARTCRFLRNGS